MSVMTTVEDWLGKENTLGIDIWNKKYRYGNETFDEWLDRVSGKDEEVKKLILEKKFLFGGRILANRGTGDKSSTSNCYVLSVKDNIDSIYETAKDMALTYKAGGGVGVDITPLAPSGAKVNNPAKTSTGAVSFIELFTTTTGLIGQNGRRGALMCSISCDHPDIEEFIKLKTDVNKATTANLSIRVSDAFMNAVKNDEDWYTAFTRPETGECISRVYKAKDLFDKFCMANYDYGEPGLLFWDTAEEYNMLSKYPNFKFAGVNPCAEEMLPDGGACLLGSINLAEFVKDDLSFDFGEFDKAVFTSVRALDKVQDEGINLHPLPIQRMMAFNWRQIGLGIMGLGDMLIKMNIRYGSKESIELCDRIGKHLAVEAIQESMALGEELGPFQCFNKKYTEASPFWKEHIKNPDFEYTAMRNSQLLAIAPTGSISTMLGISGGIEPLYSLEYERTTKSLHGEEVTYKVIPPVVEEARKAGIVDGLVCAQDIDYKDRIAMQAIWQKHIDSSISSTINLPSDFPEEEVKNIYMLAWESGCKGITVFRDGCKRAGILNSVKKEESKAKDVDSQSLIGKKRKLMTGCGSLHCTAFFDKETGKFTEIYLSKGSAGGCANFMVGLSRMVSLSARSGCTVDEIIDQLNSCGACPSYAVRKATKGDTSKGSCCPTAVGYALKEMQEEMFAEIGKGSVDVGVKAHLKPNIIQIKNPCPQCGAELAFSNGCNFCPSCGFSKCS